MSDLMTQIDTDLYDAAETVGASQHRSVAQQVDHWVRVGRELEASGGIDHRAVARVLAGQAAYDVLDQREQTLVRAAWSGQVALRRSAREARNVPRQRSESEPLPVDHQVD